MSKKEGKEVRMPVFWKDFVAGYVSGVANILAGQPFDICKVRMQTLRTGSLAQTFKSLVREEGVFKLWAGSTFPIIFFGICNSVVFATNEKCKHYFRQTNKSDTLAISQLVASGSLAGAANSLISAPMEHIRIRMQIDKQKAYKSSFDALRQIHSSFGLKGVFKGFKITLVRELFLYGAYFGSYEYIKQKFDRPSKWMLMSFGGVAGIAAWVAAYFLDSIKSKIQADSLAKPQFRTLGDLRPLLNFRDLSRGFSACIYRAYPVNCITFLVFEVAADQIYAHTATH